MSHTEQGDGLVRDVTTDNPSVEAAFDPDIYFSQWLESVQVFRFRETAEPALGVSIDGNELDMEGVVCIDDHLIEKLQAPGSLVVAEHGKLCGDVQVSTAIIDGVFEGSITATQQVIVDNHAVVIGDINTPRLTIRGGAIIEGECYFEGVFEDVKEKEDPPVWSALKIGLAKVWRGRLFH